MQELSFEEINCVSGCGVSSVSDCKTDVHAAVAIGFAVGAMIGAGAGLPGAMLGGAIGAGLGLYFGYSYSSGCRPLAPMRK